MKYLIYGRVEQYFWTKFIALKVFIDIKKKTNRKTIIVVYQLHLLRLKFKTNITVIQLILFKI